MGKKSKYLTQKNSFFRLKTDFYLDFCGWFVDHSSKRLLFWQIIRIIFHFRIFLNFSFLLFNFSFFLLKFSLFSSFSSLFFKISFLDNFFYILSKICGFFQKAEKRVFFCENERERGAAHARRSSPAHFWRKSAPTQLHHHPQVHELELPPPKPQRMLISEKNGMQKIFEIMENFLV